MRNCWRSQGLLTHAGMTQQFECAADICLDSLPIILTASKQIAWQIAAGRTYNVFMMSVLS